MSVIAMARAASRPSRDRIQTEETDSERALSVIATYIPSEALAAYLALLGLLVPAVGTPSGQVFAVKVIALAAGFALTVGLVFLTYKPGTDEPPATTRRNQALLIGFALVALFAYSLATPGGPWAGTLLGIDVTVWGAALALFLAPLLPALAASWGLRPRDSATETGLTPS